MSKVTGTKTQFNTALSDDTFAFISSNLGIFAATTSAQLAGVISDETGTGLLVFGTSPTIVTPTIVSFTNATHNHLAAAGGGTITEAAISDLQSYALATNKLDFFAATTKAELETVISDVANFAEADGDTYSGAHLFNAATMRIPLSATPTIAIDGDFAIDTTITDFSMGLIKYFDGEEMAVVALPIAELTTPTDGHVVSYSAANDEFELKAAAGAGKTFAKVIKTADETVNNSTTLQDDDQLKVSVNANKTYGFFLLLIYDSGTNPDLKVGWSVPTSATMIWNNTGFSKPNTGLSESQTDSPPGKGFDAVFAYAGYIRVAGTAGVVNFRWAQDVAIVEDTIMREGSYLLVWEE